MSRTHRLCVGADILSSDAIKLIRFIRGSRSRSFLPPVHPVTDPRRNYPVQLLYSAGRFGARTEGFTQAKRARGLLHARTYGTRRESFPTTRRVEKRNDEEPTASLLLHASQMLSRRCYNNMSNYRLAASN